MAKLKMLKPRLKTINTSVVKTVVSGDSWRSGKTTGERGYNYRWQQARERHLRAHPLCVMCQAEGHVTEATVVDHIEPHRGDEAKFWDESNWQSLCATHHSRDKQREEAKGRGA